MPDKAQQDDDLVISLVELALAQPLEKRESLSPRRVRRKPGAL